MEFFSTSSGLRPKIFLWPLGNSLNAAIRRPFSAELLRLHVFERDDCGHGPAIVQADEGQWVLASNPEREH